MTVTLNLPDDMAAELAARPDVNDFVAAAVADALHAEKAGRGNGHVPTEAAPRDGTNDPWEDQNERRVSLIQKRHRHGLTSDEQNELDRLQAEMSARINAVRPLPFDALEKLERYVDEAERRLSGKP